MKVQVHSSLEPPLEYESRPDSFDKSRLVIIILTSLEVIEILCSFRLVLEGKAGKEIPESSRLEFLEKFLTILIYQMQETTPLGCQIEET